MAKVKTLRLKKGPNVFNLKALKNKTILATIHITRDGNSIMIKPELRKGTSITIQ